MKKSVVFVMCVLFGLAGYGQDYATELQLSDNVNTYWYRIVSAYNGMETYGVTDCSSEGEQFPLQLLQTEEANKKSQWKFVKNEDGGLVVTNRETGKSIACSSVAVELLTPATQVTTTPNGGFEMTKIGENSFELMSTEDDGLKRYLGLVSRSEDLGSQTAWKLQLQEAELTGIDGALASAVKVVVHDNKIQVSGCDSWQLYSIGGEEMPRTVALPAGVYVIKANGKTLKVCLP